MKLENKRGGVQKIRMVKNSYNEENPGLYCMKERGYINIEGIKVNKGGI